MAVYVYDVNEVNMNIDGKIVIGYLEGIMVLCVKDEEKFLIKVSVKGDVSVVIKNNLLGIIMFIFFMGLLFVFYLNGLVNMVKIFLIWVIGG